MAKSIMFQGTASGVGKSLVTAAFCRIFKQDGYKVAPFKSQNMALNSFITREGMEMGRAQVTQAEAAGIEPNVDMNPILLKPTTDKKCQVILGGKVFKNMDAQEYHEYKPELMEFVKNTYDKLAKENDVVVIEGAGSPAEINLRESDLVNMGMAKMSDSPVVLIGDIDRGGVFASIAGTLLLLTEEEKKRVKGVIINKFRGDIKILEPGIKMLEDITKVPVLGVIPYSDLQIEDEDSLADRFRIKKEQKGDLKVEVVYLPHVSNFTDFNVLETQEDVDLRFVMKGEAIKNPDLLIIPGTKNTIEDLIYLRESGLEEQIIRAHKRGTVVVGICGGYQMLGQKIMDPQGIECGIEEIAGMGLLNTETTFEGEKITTRVKSKISNNARGYLENLQGLEVEGYEIHMGRTKFLGDVDFLDAIEDRLGETVYEEEGAINEEGDIIGTYLHGIFDNIGFTRGFLNNIRKKKGLDEIKSEINSFEEFKNKEYDKLANIVRSHVDIDKIYDILEG